MAKHDANKFKPVAPPPQSESRAALLSGLQKLHPLNHEIVDLPGPDGEPSGLKVKVCELTTKERYAVSEASTEIVADGEGRERKRTIDATFYPLLVQRCSRDPESDELLWLDGEADKVGALPQAITSPLTIAAMRVNGLIPKLPASASPGNVSGSVDSSSSSPES